MVVEELDLPEIIRKINGQKTAPFGDALIKTRDTIIGFEICQELFNLKTATAEMVLNGW